jgi:hypothetical protein
LHGLVSTFLRNANHRRLPFHSRCKNVQNWWLRGITDVIGWAQDVAMAASNKMKAVGAGSVHSPKVSGDEIYAMESTL